MTFTKDTEYNRENFQALYELVNGSSFLGNETVTKVNRAISENDDEYLNSIYDILLDLHVKNELLNTIFEEQQKALISEYTDTVVSIKKEADEAAKKVRMEVEMQEKEEAENILLKII